MKKIFLEKRPLFEFLTVILMGQVFVSLREGDKI